MFVRIWMTRDPITIGPGALVSEALALMDKGAFRHLPVTEGGKVLGMLSEDEIRNRELSSSETKVEHYMNRDPIQVDPYLPLEEAVLLLRRNKSGGLPVLHKGKLVGILTESDVFDAFSQIMAAEVEAVRVTFDGPEGDRMLRKAVVLCERFDLDVYSFVSHVRGADQGRRMFAVRGQGGRVEEFVEALWKEGFRVLQALIPGPKARGAAGNESLPIESAFVIEGPRTGEALSWLSRKVDDYGLELITLTSRPHGEKSDRARVGLRVKGFHLDRFERELTQSGFEVIKVKVLAAVSVG
jgi:acetoin utilization protein AcuB